MPSENYKKLLENAGAGAGVNITGDWQIFYGGEADFWVWGDLGGGKVHLEAALDESAPCFICGTSITETSPTSAGIAKFNLAPSTKIRAATTLTLKVLSTGMKIYN